MSETTEVSYLGMSDDELMKLDPASVEQAEVTEQPVVEEVVQETVSEVQEDTADEQESTDAEEVLVQEVPATVAEDKSAEEQVVDYKAMYERITTPFKANGKDIAVKNVDDAISLMQMGANYNKKMAALKPNLKLMKLLENNGLLNEERIGFLIDLEKKNPNAINKLIKDSGLDPMDLDAEKASEYKPNTYTVDDREMELDTVLDEIQGTPSYNRTLEIVSTKWDGSSKQVIASSPQLLKVINAHVQNGIYDTIIKEVDSERVYGRLDGLSDIEAYRKVGDAIQARGGFASMGNQEQQTPGPVVVVPKPKLADDDKLRDKKRAASSTKPVSSNQINKDFNPLSLSDEEFSKVIKDKYL